MTELDGPPRTPFERARRRRNLGLVLVALVAVVAAVVALVLAVTAGPDAEVPASAEDGASSPQDGATPAPSDPGDGTDDDGPAAPSLEDLEARDRELAAVLIDVDGAERVMLRFDDEVSTAFDAVDPEDPATFDAALATTRAAAARGVDGLDALRPRLAVPADDVDTEAVRAAYLAHLDAWRTYLASIAAAPGRLVTPGATDTDTLLINVTAEAFRRAVEDRLPADLDPEVAAFAEAILDRGFRGAGDRTPAA